MATKLKRELTRIAMRYRLSAIFAFGSRSADAAAIINRTKCSGEYSSSDIDVGVLPLEGVKMGPREKVRLTVDLEDLLRVKKVDLVVLPEADPFLAANVIRGERIYCEDEYAADEYGLYILRRAGDLIPLEEEDSSYNGRKLMIPGKLNSRILADRVAWINRMLEEVGKLPLDDYERFIFL